MIKDIHKFFVSKDNKLNLSSQSIKEIVTSSSLIPKKYSKNTFTELEFFIFLNLNIVKKSKFLIQIQSIDLSKNILTTT